MQKKKEEQMVLELDVEPTTLQMIPLTRITERLPIRRLSPSGVARLKASIDRYGFLENYPLTVLLLDDGNVRLIDGNHRLEAALSLGLARVPSVVKTDLTEAECFALALRCNSATEAFAPWTLVTYAEFVWARLAEQDERDKSRYTQLDVAQMLGWSDSSVSNYAQLDTIDKQAWATISTTFEEGAEWMKTLVVEEDSTTVEKRPTSRFTERLLRCAIGLLPEQQIELVRELATNKQFTKGKFKMQAENYQTRNEMYKHASKQLGDLGEPYTTKLHEEVYSGAYDADWKTPEHPKLEKLLTALREEWERKNSIHLICGDFYEEVGKLGNGCIDLILTDPPYNIARENEFELEGHSNISQDFGEWDKHNESEFIASFDLWAQHWARILREQGSGYVFTSDRYLSHLRAALEAAGLHVKATIVWHKTNPGTQVVKTNFKSSVEYVLFFTKGQGGHTFNWQGENEMHNFIETPVCAGKERLVNAKGEGLHPTQKPEQVLRHFLEISSNRGDTVFDGFAGVGSTGKVAKDLGRKFIGIEQDQAYFDAMLRRLTD